MKNWNAFYMSNTFEIEFMMGVGSGKRTRGVGIGGWNYLQFCWRVSTYIFNGYNAAFSVIIIFFKFCERACWYANINPSDKSVESLGYPGDRYAPRASCFYTKHFEWRIVYKNIDNKLLACVNGISYWWIRNIFHTDIFYIRHCEMSQTQR